jgi:hypothetical protein
MAKWRRVPLPLPRFRGIRTWRHTGATHVGAITGVAPVLEHKIAAAAEAAKNGERAQNACVAGQGARLEARLLAVPALATCTR